MVPDTRVARCFSIVAEGGSNAWDLVSGNSGTRAGPAADNPLVDSATSDCLSNVTARQGPISFEIIFGDGTKEDKLKAINKSC